MRLLTCLCFLISSYITVQADNRLTLTMGARSVDLGRYHFAYPYYIDEVDFRTGTVFFSIEKPGQSRRLYRTTWDLHGPIDLTTADKTPISNLDLNHINFWSTYYNHHLDRLIVMGGLDQTETINLWLYPNDDGAPQKLTKVDYVYSWSVTPDETRIYFISRYGSDDHARGCLELLYLTAPEGPRQETLVCDDKPGYPSKLRSWGGIRIDGKDIYLVSNSGRRDDKQLLRHDLETGGTTIVAEFPDSPFFWLVSLVGGPGQVVYADADKLLVYDAATGTSRQLGAYSNSLRSVDAITDFPNQILAVTVDGISEREVFYYRFDGKDLHQIGQDRINGSFGFTAFRHPTFLRNFSSIDIWWKFDAFQADQNGISARFPFIDGLDELNESLRHCESEKVQFTHDDAATGEIITIDAYLLQPRDPVPPNQRLYVIEAFYGGGNWFSIEDQLLCAVGVTVLSPTVRGDDRRDEAFEQANDGANADAPIRDVIASARWLVDRLDIEDPRRIGLKGFSHGGWAAVRGLTWPGDGGFDFGFALAGAGPYDLAVMADTSQGATNITGWIEKEFGSAKTDGDRLAFLSPVNHVDRLSAPLFLFHGSDDNRIAVTSTTDFAKKLTAAGKEGTVLILPDQGHGVGGPSDQHRLYQAMFDFLSTVLAGVNR